MGKKIRTYIALFFATAAAVCLSAGLAACSGGEKENKNAGVYNVGEEGIYYCDAGASEYLMTLQSGVYMISVGGAASSSGTYSCDEEAGTITFKTYDGETFTASLSDGAMKLDIGMAYTFLKKVNYDVTFMDGNSEMTSQSVTYGKAAEAADGEKEGYIFLGWYEDADFTTKYSFDSAVTGDVTLYARYVETDSTIANFEVEFVSGGDVIYTTSTQNGVVYDFPETEALGWWVSATNDESELTYKYDGGILTEATKLFAVEEGSLGASIYGDRIAWEGSASSATVTIGGVGSFTATGSHYPYDFASLPTGTYYITVEAQGYGEEELVYVSNALSRVSNFSIRGNILVYNAVENAQYYCVSVECANSSHEHAMVYNGNTLTYDFSGCEMGPEGIKFTVYAYAAGYVESVSDTFVYALVLDDTRVTIDEASDTAFWTAVSGATGYEVYVNGELAMTTTETEYSIKNEERGTEIEIAVKPVASGYWSEISDFVKYTKSTLKAPEIISVSGYTISWEKIDGAVGYELNINGYLVDVEPAEDGEDAPTTCVLSDTTLSYIFSDARNAVSVTAMAKDPSENSQPGDITYVTDAVMGSALSYADGVITWDYVLAANSYTVELDGSVVATVSGKNACGITFTHGGESEIKVYFDDSSFASLTVYTYAVIFDVRGYGEDTPDTLYVVKGEKVTTPEPDSSAEYVAFSGWYTLPDEFDPNAVGYTGFGREFVSGTRFDGNSTLVLYACWTAEKAEMALEAGEYGFTDEPSALAPYGTSDYTLPVPELTDTTRVFLGWYSEEDGKGTRYTDENGDGLVTVTGSAKLYAKYGTAVTLSLTTFEGEDVLEAKKGGDIQYVRDGVVTVPATYEVDGAVYEVAVLNSNAFYNSKYIYTLNIPDTMKYVSVVNNGYSSGTGAFSQSPNIEAVNVYVTGEGPDPLKVVRYYSSDGVLYCKNPETCEVSLVYYPQGRTSGKCVIPECVFNETECELVDGSPDTYLPVYNAVTTISAMVFSAHPCLESVTIPATVTSIESQAFYNCKSLATVTMLAIVSGGEVEAADTLVIADDAFSSCSNLTEVTLASRLVSFDSGFFSGCTSLTDVNVSVTGDPDVDNYSSLDGVLLNASGNELMYYPAARTEFLIADGSITEIGPYAVTGNTNIGSAVIPARIQLIGEGAFYGCTGLTELVFESLGDFNALSLTIGEKAFYGCTGLTSVCLPENLVSLGRFAFGGCSSLTYVSFDAKPETSELDFAAGAFATDTGAGDTDGVYYVTTVDIGPNAPEVDLTAVFGPYLSGITVDDENPNYDMSVEGLVMNSSGTKIIYCLAGYEGAVVIPEGITETGNVFREKSITSVTIPVSLHTIEDDAFRDCKNLSEVIFAEGRDRASLTVGDRAFYGCASLTSIAIPRGLVYLGDMVFYGCSALASVTLPEGLESIGDYVFYNCSSLSYLYLPSTLEKMGTEDCGVFFVFYGCKALATICISEDNPCFACENGILYGLHYDETSETYVGTEVYRAFAGAEGDVILSSSVEKIWYRAFYQSTGITTFSYEGAVARLDVGENAFFNCTSLTSVSLPEGLTELSLEMFESCSALVSVCLPESLTAVGSRAFYNCSSLPSLTIPDGVASIGEYAFYRCTSLESVVFPDNLKTVGDSAFESCTSLESVVIPDAVTAVGDKAFYKCTSLFSVTLGKGVETIGGYAFWSCSKLETLSIDCDVTFMGIWAFADCKSLKSVTVSGDVTSIGVSAFRRCTSLVSVAVTGDVSSIEANAFCDCTSLEYVVLPASLTCVEDAAFSGCSSLESVYFLGTADEWNVVSVVGRNNGELTSAEIYFYSESEPAGDGNFWHFVDGKPAIWTKD